MRQPASKASILAFSLILVLGVFGIISSSIISKPTNNQNLRSKAAAATTLVLKPSSAEVAPQTPFTVNVELNPGTNIVTATVIDVHFDPLFLEATEIVKQSALPEVLETAKIDNINGNVSLTVGMTQGLPLTTSPKIVAKITFKSKLALGNTTISFNDNTKVAETINDITNSVLSSATPATISIIDPCVVTPINNTLGPIDNTKWTTTTDGVQLKKQLCGNFEATVDVNDIATLEAGISIASSAVPKIGNSVSLKIKRIGNNIESFYNNGGGWVRFENKTNSTTDNLNLRIKTNNTASLSNFVFITNPQLTTASDLNVKVKLRRMSVKDNDLIPTQVKLTNAAGTTILIGTVDFKSDANGVYSYTFSGLPTGQTTLWLKPKFFLSKKYTLNLENGAKTLDNTAVPILGGDVTSEDSNLSATGDNVVNIYDYSLMIINFSLNTKKPGHPADVNKDEYVSTLDYSEITGNFAKRGEQ